MPKRYALLTYKVLPKSARPTYVSSIEIVGALEEMKSPTSFPFMPRLQAGHIFEE
jgi:hypothetical protein